MKIDRSKERKSLKVSGVPSGTVFSFYDSHLGGDLYLKIKPFKDSHGNAVNVINLTEDRVAVIGEDSLVFVHPNAKVVIE